MNTREPFDLAKGAISMLLLCLVIGAGISFFYFLFDTSDKTIDKMEHATTSSNMDRLYELRDTTNASGGDINDLPLVTNVISALTEFNEEELLYVCVLPPENDKADVYTYTGVTISNASGSDTVPTTVHNSDIPITELCRYLLKYSDCRCELIIGTYDIATNTRSIGDGGNGLTFVQLYIKRDPFLKRS